MSKRVSECVCVWGGGWVCVVCVCVCVCVRAWARMCECVRTCMLECVRKRLRAFTNLPTRARTPTHMPSRGHVSTKSHNTYHHISLRSCPTGSECAAPPVCIVCVWFNTTPHSEDRQPEFNQLLASICQIHALTAPLRHVTVQ